MRYLIDAWAYQEPETGLRDLITEFADMGFDGVSVSVHQLLDLDADDAREVTALLHNRGLAMTVHSNFSLQPVDAERLLARLGDLLYCITFDAATVKRPCGTQYDATRMSALLQAVLAMSAGTDLRVGVEDFPLDQPTVDLYRDDLQPLLACPRHGMLLDVGHLNLRLRRAGRPAGPAVVESLRRLPVPVIELHLHDNRGQRDDHAPLGFGDIRFEEVATGLKGIGFDGVSTFEITPRYYGSTPAESKPHARESLACWKRIWEG